MKKIIYIGIIIIASLFAALRFADHIAPYIQFKDEIFYASKPIVYKGVEINITNIYRNNEYRIEHRASEDFVMEPVNGHEFIFIDMEFMNTSENYFAASDLYWQLKGETIQGKDCNSGAHNMDGLYPSVEPGGFTTYTLVFSLPKDSKLTELLYYKNINNMGSITKPLTKAPDFKIIFDE